MSKTYIDNEGNQSYYPFDPETAAAEKLGKWHDRNGCDKCGQPEVLRYLQGNICQTCLINNLQQDPTLSVEPFSRADALALEKDYYYKHSADLCKKGPHLLKRPITGPTKCLICMMNKEIAKQEKPTGNPDELFMEHCPQSVISRDSAKLLGLGVYRTGKPCRKHGHTGFRYVSSCNCVDCHRSR